MKVIFLLYIQKYRLIDNVFANQPIFNYIKGDKISVSFATLEQVAETRMKRFAEGPLPIA